MVWSIISIAICLSVWQAHSQLVETNVQQWVCQNGYCTKYIEEAHDDTNYKYPSLDVCRLTCGYLGVLWPAPTGLELSIGQEVASINSQIQFLKTENPLDRAQASFLKSILKIFKENIAKKCGKLPIVSGDSFLQITTQMDSPDIKLDMTTDERYLLHIAKPEANVSASVIGGTIYGVRHGLETLSQLIAPLKNRTHCLLFVASRVDLSDGPSYPHRGLLLDTSRHYIPVSAIKRTIDGMAASKLNVFHWHMTDTHSFPFKSKAVPQMSQYGAYSEEEVYSIEDIVDLVMYAQHRGVRIMPEIDGPAHAGNGWQWGEEVGLGKLVLCHNSEPWPHYCMQPPCGQLNPANDNLYLVLKKLFKEFQSIFDSSIVHLGGDEVALKCWRMSKEITDWLESNNLPPSDDSYYLLWAYFHSKSLLEWDRAKGDSSSKIVLWSSHLTDPQRLYNISNERYVIEIWADAEDALTEELLSMNYSVILAYRNKWYLDHGFWGSTTYNSWSQIYNTYIPKTFGSRLKGVLGGEAAMWSEYVDENSLDMKIWPRAAALGEKLWTNPNSASSYAERRFYVHREELVKRGIKADAVTPQWCYLNDGKCP